jgi:peptidoglycan/xylan/chitin deacetylase (PgdA/CDA1 family)
VRVALTFDAEHPDRPGNDVGVADATLEILSNEALRATFFLQGRWVEAYPATASRIVSDGHLVGNHSFFHARMPLLTDEGLRTDVRDAEQAIREIALADPKPWFRCPFGIGEDDLRVLGALEELGYRNVSWDVWSYDWDYEATPEAVEQAVLEGVLEHGDSAVVLLHTWSVPMRESLPRIIARLRELGAELVTVAEVLPEEVELPEPG